MSHSVKPNLVEIAPERYNVRRPSVPGTVVVEKELRDVRSGRRSHVTWLCEYATR